MREADDRTYRRAMVESQIEARGLADPRLLEAMIEIPRHAFVEGCSLAEAYGDYPLPIGEGQTISQPFIIALMISMAGIEPGDRVLEIGTGSGYQTALLARMGMDVVSLELRPLLAASASRAVSALGLENGPRMIVADGYSGWEPAAPYGAIIVSAAPPSIPDALPRQLREGGCLVLPVGEGMQRLVRVTRTGGRLEIENGDFVRFVPMVRAGSRRRWL
jgi:protein-L-isoaspartate(D-aspartate) O-methyltransferase